MMYSGFELLADCWWSIFTARLLAFFGSLEATGQTDQARAGQHGLKQHQAQPNPAVGKPIQVEPLAVEQVKEAVVSLGAEAQDANIACDTGASRPTTEGRQRQDHPQKGA